MISNCKNKLLKKYNKAVFSAFELVDLLICLIGPSEFRLKLEFEQRIGRRHRPNVDIGNIFEMGLPPKKSKTNGTDARRSTLEMVASTNEKKPVTLPEFLETFVD